MGSVEIMPSERTEEELRAEELRKVREEQARIDAEAAEQARLNRAADKAALLGAEPCSGVDVVQILLRLPSGGRLQRRFHRDTHFKSVLDWVESQPESNVSPELFRIVQKWPGHCRELGHSNSMETLASLGFSRQEAVFLQHLSDADTQEGEKGRDEVQSIDDVRNSTLDSPMSPALRSPRKLAASQRSVWSSAEETSHQMLDRRLNGEETPTSDGGNQLEELHGQELVEVFHRLIAFGMPNVEAAFATKRFASQLRELSEMGFHNWPRAVQLLEKYNGRLLRVANVMSEEDLQESTVDSVAPASTTMDTSIPDSAVAPPSTTKGNSTSDDVEIAQFPPHTWSETHSQSEPHSQSEGPDLYDTYLAELAGMGFPDVERNRQLLKKYACRMDRVVEALCSPV